VSAEPQPDAAVEDETLQRCPCIDCPLPAGCALRQQKRVVFRLAYVEQIFCIREQADLAEQLKAARLGMEKYRVALRELAK